MAIDYTYDKQRNIINVTVTNQLTMTSITEYVNSVLNNSTICDGFIEKVHFEDVTDFNFSYNESLTMSSLFNRLKTEKGYRGSVVIAPNDLQYGMVRMMTISIEEYSPVIVVRSEQEAEEEISHIRNG